MSVLRIPLLVGGVLTLAIAGFGFFAGSPGKGLQTESLRGESAPTQVLRAPSRSTVVPSGVHEDITFVGPRDGVPDDAPKAYGFWSFATPVSGVLSRSGQPLAPEFSWLKDHGWKSVVNLRIDGERGEVGDDTKLMGFSALGLTYLHLPLTDGQPPTNEQAERFLAFVTDPANLPVHVHCRGGIGRTGTMVALYRYAVQGWPIDTAIEESRAFRGGISGSQKTWLEYWAATHPPGSHRP